MAVLSQGVGYGVVIGLGALFAITMSLVTKALHRYLNENQQSSEMYMTAQRTVKMGLTASAIVSAWTWAATLLQSTSMAYKYGISGSFWYAAGATVQVLLFAVLAIELKKRAPNAHTFLEIVYARYGKSTHIVYLCFALATNIVVSAMLLLGGSAVVSYLTDMNVIAACFLLPVGVIIYTLFGGIKATFLTDYAHTAVIFIIIISFVLTVYATSPLIGSPSKMYDMLVASAQASPIPDNAQGSLLTMSSLGALIFGIINICGNTSTVGVDQAYWQRAIASHPAYAVKAYLMGGLSWFAIPFGLATCLGLAGRALQIDISASDVSAGLVLPDVASRLLGPAGAFASLILVFMAVTSASSAELIAVSSLLTYDVFRTYIRPGASGKAVIRFSHSIVIGFGFFMSILAVILRATGVDLGYLYTLMGVLLCPAVAPLMCTLLWSKQSKLAATVSPIIGLACGLIAWLVTAQGIYGEITLESTAANYPMLAGNLASIIVPIPCLLVLTWIKPQNFDWESTKAIQQVADPDEEDNKNTISIPIEPKPVVVEETPEETMAGLLKASRFAKISSLVLTLVLVILWPLPMFGSQYVFSREFFTGWVVVSIIWIFCSTCAVAIYPVIESRAAIATVFKGIYQDITSFGKSESSPQGTSIASSGDQAEVILAEKN
ncbi:hypothetical protein INT43_003265 [Umbelopsis isabellina]|uniref:Urea transporter n=1 Tax=Mortierella isabellina TaxID=91625 RepID=A0A8H7UDY0_MORIS|nr:hypothetical protein INT43_003265 [Umbelopsis isabellina]